MFSGSHESYKDDAILSFGCKFNSIIAFGAYQSSDVLATMQQSRVHTKHNIHKIHITHEAYHKNLRNFISALRAPRRFRSSYLYTLFDQFYVHV